MSYNKSVAKDFNTLYTHGNDCEMPDCWVASAYHDGIHEQFKEEFPNGFADIQPSFKLNMEVKDGKTQWKGAGYDAEGKELTDEDKLLNPNWPAQASGYSTTSAIMPASKAWPKYEEYGRGNVEGEQEGYVAYPTVEG